jgi:hypothetical protein
MWLRFRDSVRDRVRLRGAVCLYRQLRAHDEASYAFSMYAVLIDAGVDVRSVVRVAAASRRPAKGSVAMPRDVV